MCALTLGVPVPPLVHLSGAVLFRSSTGLASHLIPRAGGSP
jgi:hypothetical protein